MFGLCVSGMTAMGFMTLVEKNVARNTKEGDLMCS